jgi:hypothetical protein
MPQRLASPSWLRRRDGCRHSGRRPLHHMWCRHSVPLALFPSAWPTDVTRMASNTARACVWVPGPQCVCTAPTHASVVACSWACIRHMLFLVCSPVFMLFLWLLGGMAFHTRSSSCECCLARPTFSGVDSGIDMVVHTQVVVFLRLTRMCCHQ